MSKRGRVESRNLVCGFHAVESAANSGRHRIAEILVDGKRQDPRMRRLTESLQGAGVPVRSATRLELNHACGNTRHQGIVAVVHSELPRRTQTLDGMLDGLGGRETVLVLDQVQDPHNLGACIRTAECAGVRNIVLPRDGACPVNQTVRKVASGAVERVDIVYVPNLARALVELQARGFWVYGADDTGDQPLYDCHFPDKSVVVMGAEGSGLRRLTKTHCDHLVNIPMQGLVSSLNVSTATAVILFEILRQRQHGETA
ncbi:MAG: 23S rRNA (guanosine(2251)-2'-O)-methyltransferase RlmB [Gammaproteobacteria bacterium]|nr:23S rRNA (guanosine(2251)-2'-O)-methyltransferase RlmB [Gammaproteobacteria bacterium]